MVDFVDVDRRLSANLFDLLEDIFLFFNSPKFRKASFSSKFSVAKIFSGSDNPPVQVRLAVDYCVKWGLLCYSSDGKLFFDFSAFEKFFRNTRRGKKMFLVVEEFYTITY